jgi:hypothetical protein
MQLEFSLIPKKDPRSVYLHSLREMNIDPEFDDYIDSSEFRVDVDTKTYAALQQQISSSATHRQNLITSTEIFKDYDTRVIVESIIYAHDYKAAAKYLDVSSGITKMYESVFFDLTDFKYNLTGFRDFIIFPEVIDWFDLVAKTDVNHLRHVIKGKPRPGMEPGTSIIDLMNICTNNFKSYAEKLNPGSLQKITEDQERVAKIGMAYGSLAKDLFRIYFQYYKTITKDERDFLKEFDIIMQRTPQQIQGGGDSIAKILAEVKDQMRIVNPEIPDEIKNQVSSD